MPNKTLEILLSRRKKKKSFDLRLPPRNVPEERRSHKIHFLKSFNGVTMRYSQIETRGSAEDRFCQYCINISDPSGSMKEGKFPELLKFVTRTLVLMCVIPVLCLNYMVR